VDSHTIGYRNVRNRVSGKMLLSHVRWCASFSSRLRGFMFRTRLKENEALILVGQKDTRSGTSIHMYFVPFALGVVWINEAGQVVDKVKALPWKAYYEPCAPARYTLETTPEFLDQVSVGDELVFEKIFIEDAYSQ